MRAIEALFDLPRALEAQTGGEWLLDQTVSQGPIPAIIVLQQADEDGRDHRITGIEKSDLQVEANENTVRSLAKSRQIVPNSAHRREWAFGDFDRMISLPVQVEPTASTSIKSLEARARPRTERTRLPLSKCVACVELVDDGGRRAGGI